MYRGDTGVDSTWINCKTSLSDWLASINGRGNELDWFLLLLLVIV